MKPSTIFAVGYLVGTAAGMPSGAWLPWWWSGLPAWSFACFVFWLRPLSPTDNDWRYSMREGRPELGRYFHELHRIRVRCLALGLFWGAMAGASATAMPQVLGVLVWPGHDDAGLGIVVATLTALGWLAGAVLEPDDVPALRPGVVGLGLYLVVTATCALPALWEVL